MKLKEEIEQMKSQLHGLRLDILKQLCALDVKAADSNNNLKEHMRRTELSETRLMRLENWTLGLLSSILLALLGVLVKSFLN